MATVLGNTTTFTALGIRFWDAASETQVRDGLAVTAHRADGTGSAVEAYRTGAGIYAFQGLPGLRALEFPNPGPADLGSIAVPLAFVVQVTDLRRRFVPVAFTVTLPLLERGIYPLASMSSPPEDPSPGFYLFSAASRPATPGLAVVRANLVDAVTGEPAAHAVLELDGAGEVHYGIADAEGRVSLLFPYPTIDALQEESPPPGQASLAQQQWSLTFRVRYAPSELSALPGSTLPELRDIVNQTPGRFRLSDAASPPAEELLDEWTDTLRFGQECILKTQGRSDLFIETLT